MNEKKLTTNEEKMKDDNTNKEMNVWKYLVYVIIIIILCGIAFKLGEIIASVKELTTREVLESFYKDSWIVYTTIFGVIGVVLGVVFPIVQSKKQDEKYQADMNKINNTLKELNSFKDKYEIYLKDLKAQSDDIKEKMDNAWISNFTHEFSGLQDKNIDTFINNIRQNGFDEVFLDKLRRNIEDNPTSN